MLLLLFLHLKLVLAPLDELHPELNEVLGAVGVVLHSQLNQILGAAVGLVELPHIFFGDHIIGRTEGEDDRNFSDQVEVHGVIIGENIGV